MTAEQVRQAVRSEAALGAAFVATETAIVSTIHPDDALRSCAAIERTTVNALLRAAFIANALDAALGIATLHLPFLLDALRALLSATLNLLLAVDALGTLYPLALHTLRSLSALDTLALNTLRTLRAALDALRTLGALNTLRTFGALLTLDLLALHLLAFGELGAPGALRTFGALLAPLGFLAAITLVRALGGGGTGQG
jgi:hypothetical protein